MCNIIYTLKLLVSKSDKRQSRTVKARHCVAHIKKCCLQQHYVCMSVSCIHEHADSMEHSKFQQWVCPIACTCMTISTCVVQWNVTTTGILAQPTLTVVSFDLLPTPTAVSTHSKRTHWCNSHFIHCTKIEVGDGVWGCTRARHRLSRVGGSASYPVLHRVTSDHLTRSKSWSLPCDCNLACFIQCQHWHAIIRWIRIVCSVEHDKINTLKHMKSSHTHTHTQTHTHTSSKGEVAVKRLTSCWKWRVIRWFRWNSKCLACGGLKAVGHPASTISTLHWWVPIRKSSCLWLFHLLLDDWGGNHALVAIKSDFSTMASLTHQTGVAGWYRHNTQQLESRTLVSAVACSAQTITPLF